MILTDVVVCTSLTPGGVARDQPMASKLQGRKQKKYAGVAAHLGAELFNVSVEAHGWHGERDLSPGTGYR